MAQDACPTPEIYTFRANLTNNDATLLYDPPLSLTHAQERGSIHIGLLDEKACAGWGSLHSVRPLFFAHVCCWKAACQQQQRDLGGLDLYGLARQTRRIIPQRPFLKRMNGALLRDQIPPILPPSLVVAEETDLARLITRTWARLPAELQEEVGKYLPNDSLAVSLARACQTAALINLAEVHHPEPSRVAVERSSHGANWLSVSMTSLFGQKYLGRITLTRRAEKPTPAGPGIPFDGEAISAVHFVLGVYGLRAIRLGYLDGSSSPWLGEPNRGYYGATFGKSNSTISILSDVRGPLSFT